VIAQLIRSLYSQHGEDPSMDLRKQFLHLRVRIVAIRRMQVAGVSSFMLCVMRMFALCFSWRVAANVLFAASLLLLFISLGFSLYEVQISGQTLDMQLKNLEHRND
jgi:hypothetical protein